MFERIAFPERFLLADPIRAPKLLHNAELFVCQCEQAYLGRFQDTFTWAGCKQRFWWHVANTLLYEPVFDTAYHRSNWGDTRNNNRAWRNLSSVFLRGV